MTDAPRIGMWRAEDGGGAPPGDGGGGKGDRRQGRPRVMSNGPRVVRIDENQKMRGTRTVGKNERLV